MDEQCVLIRQAQQGDVDAYEQIVRRFQNMAVAYGYATLGDFHLAEDAAQVELLEQALVYAAINGCVDVVAFLLDRGANINAQPTGFDVRLTPLHWAVVRGQQAVVALLAERQADLTIRDPQYHATALGWAVYHGMDGIAALLRRHGAVE